MLMMAPVAQAQTSVVGTPSGASTISGVIGVFGFRFTVGASDLSVTSLGAYDWSTSSDNQNIEVTIYSTAGVSIVTDTVATGSNTLVGDYRFVTLDSPTTLTAGVSYDLLMYYEQDESRMLWNGASASYDTAITFVSSLSLTNSGNVHTTGNEHGGLAPHFPNRRPTRRSSD